jgi:hypothetical protein
MIAHARRCAPFTLAVPQRSLSVIASTTTPHNGSKEHPMITDIQTRIIVLQLTDELLTQLQPYLAELDATPRSEWAEQVVYEHGRFAGYEKVEQRWLRLTMSSETYDALTTRVNGALDYDLHWQPNEYEPDGFVERVRPLELINGNYTQTGCPTCGVRLLANRTEVACACSQEVSLI